MDLEFRYNKLKGRIVEVYESQDRFAKALGISPSALSSRLNNTTEFSQREILQAIKLLGISADEMEAYFFKPKVKKS